LTKINAGYWSKNESLSTWQLGSFTVSLLPTQCTPESAKELATLVEQYKGVKPQALKSVLTLQVWVFIFIQNRKMIAYREDEKRG
jgi:hypothetical protein